MPKNAPKIKIENTKKYKADVILYDPETQSRESIGEKISIEENRTLIRPYDDIDIIAGRNSWKRDLSSTYANLNCSRYLFVLLWRWRFNCWYFNIFKR